jgi:hypothetical protein
LLPTVKTILKQHGGVGTCCAILNLLHHPVIIELLLALNAKPNLRFVNLMLTFAAW